MDIVIGMIRRAEKYGFISTGNALELLFGDRMLPDFDGIEFIQAVPMAPTNNY